MKQNYDTPATANRLFLATIGAFFICMIIIAGTTMAGVAAGWVNLSDIGGSTTTESGRQALRAYLLLSNLIPFAGTAALALFFVFRRNWLAAAGLKTPPSGNVFAWSAAFFVTALPFVGWLAYLNLQVDLPEWMQANEDNTDTLLKGILQMESIPEFLLAFLTIGVTPAIGEELLMRGVLQRRVFQPWFDNHHAAIWAAAVLFSTVHFEFGGFAPRLLLGLLLGYAYHWSRSLWVPVILHLLFNGFQVLVAYVSGEFDPTAEATDIPPWWLGLISLAIVLVIGWLAERKFAGPEATQEIPPEQIITAAEWETEN